MSVKNKVGLWMDHSEATIIKLENEATLVATIKNQFGHENTEVALSKSEHLMHNKRQQQLASFFKTVSDSIEPFNKVF